MKTRLNASCAALVLLAGGLGAPAIAGQDAADGRQARPATVASAAAGSGGATGEQAKPVPQPAKPKPQPAKPKPAPLTPAQLARRAPGRPGSFEVLAGAAFLGSGSVGSTDANLTASGSTTPYRYFTTSGSLGSAPALDARVTYNLTRRMAIEGGLNYSAPSLQVTIANDAESAAGVTPSEKLKQYFIDASLLVFLPKASFSRGRGRVFVEGGAGYLRQLHEGNFSVETGQVYNVGGGVKYFFKPRPRGFVKGFGLRVDVRAYYKSGGYTFDGTSTWSMGGAGGAVIAF